MIHWLLERSTSLENRILKILIITSSRTKIWWLYKMMQLLVITINLFKKIKVLRISNNWCLEWQIWLKQVHLEYLRKVWTIGQNLLKISGNHTSILQEIYMSLRKYPSQRMWWAGMNSGDSLMLTIEKLLKNQRKTKNNCNSHMRQQLTLLVYCFNSNSNHNKTMVCSKCFTKIRKTKMRLSNNSKLCRFSKIIKFKILTLLWRMSNSLSMTTS